MVSACRYEQILRLRRLLPEQGLDEKFISQILEKSHSERVKRLVGLIYRPLGIQKIVAPLPRGLKLGSVVI